MGDIISLGERRGEPAEFCLSVTLTSDGKVQVDMDQSKLETRAQVNWALSQLALAIHDLVVFKKDLPDGV